MNQRVRRVSEMILREIGSIMQLEMRDARFKMVTITHVNVSDDLGNAKIYFSAIADAEQKKELAKALNHAQGFFRAKLGERMEMKYIPQIKFYFDESIEYADKIEQLFKEIKSEKNH
jgi:ribosome-binding factor A